MSTKERSFLVSEIATLEDLIRRVPADRPIHRKGFQARLESVRAELDNLPEPPPHHRGEMLFRGNPVAGSHGIYASFAGEATRAFSEAFTTVREALAGTLGNQGPVAGGDRSKLLITGTATGSFGFTFEVPVEPSLPEHDAPDSTALAVPKILDLLSEASQGEGEGLADIVAEIHPRAVGKVRDFLDVLLNHGAWCRLEYEHRPFVFRDSSEVRQARHALRAENMEESDQELVGVLEGILPTARQIEFRVPGEDAPLRLRIHRELIDVGGLKRFMDKTIRVRVHATRLSNRKPRYELLSVVRAPE